MEIYLAEEQIFYYVPRFNLEIARDRVDQKKASLVAGTVGALLSRPKPEEIQLVSVENRFDPYWIITISSKTKYDRNRTYTIPVSGIEVQRVSILGSEIPLDAKTREPSFSLNGVEHCYEERRASRTFDGLEGKVVDLSRYQSFPKNVVEQVETFAPEGAMVVPPQLKATAVVRQVMSEVIKPAQNAHVIHEERVDVEAIELNFLPVFAFEFEWTPKGKRSVAEFDALTGDIRSSGRKLSDQVKGMMNRDLLFDVTADAVGLIVPGGSIAVKLVKAVVDSGKK